jgi:hypothetical protein
LAFASLGSVLPGFALAFVSLGFESVFASPGGFGAVESEPACVEPVVGVDAGGEALFVKRGGPSPDGSLDWGAGEVGAAAGVGCLTFVGSRVKRGGSSPGSIPTGVVSAFSAVAAGSLPAGAHFPVPSHGLSTLTALLCNALPTVNKPKELPARSPSYTVPVSSAIGTGSALYAEASQNFPSIKIAIGTSETLPLAAI